MPRRRLTIEMNASAKTLEERRIGAQIIELIEAIAKRHYLIFPFSIKIRVNLTNEDKEGPWEIQESDESDEYISEILEYISEIRKDNRRLRGQVRECKEKQQELSNTVLKLMSARDMRKAIDRLKEKMLDKGIKEVFVVDRYLLKLDQEQVDALLELIGSEKRVTIYTDVNEAKPGVQDQIQSRNENIRFISLRKEEDRDIHDRVWLWNKEADGIGIEGVAVGTSFNGFGKHITFILDLPQEDAKAFFEELQMRFPKDSANPTQ